VNLAPGDPNSKALNGLAEYSRTVIGNAVRREPTPQKMVQVFRKAALITDANIREKLAIVERLPPEQQIGRTLACGPGCAYCCYQWVRCTVPEVLAVAEYIRQNWIAPEIETLIVDLGRYREEFTSKPKGSLFALPCPLLRDNMCSVYGVRPFICRGCNSLDVEKCAEGVVNPLETLIPVAMPLVNIAAAIRQGITQGIGDVGLPNKELVFALALATALQIPDAGTRYLAGENVFISDQAD
jgi:hypothetical protein